LQKRIYLREKHYLFIFLYFSKHVLFFQVQPSTLNISEQLFPHILFSVSSGVVPEIWHLQSQRDKTHLPPNSSRLPEYSLICSPVRLHPKAKSNSIIRKNNIILGFIAEQKAILVKIVYQNTQIIYIPVLHYREKLVFN
jgi:hypothetical protein